MLNALPVDGLKSILFLFMVVATAAHVRRVKFRSHRLPLFLVLDWFCVSGRSNPDGGYITSGRYLLHQGRKAKTLIFDGELSQCRKCSFFCEILIFRFFTYFSKKVICKKISAPFALSLIVTGFFMVQVLAPQLHCLHHLQERNIIIFWNIYKILTQIGYIRCS